MAVMKRIHRFHTASGGFTLVELLVVVTIIIILAAIAFTVGPKMMRRGDAAKSMENLRQIGPLMMTYAADNNFRLPAMRPMIKDENGRYVSDLHWHQALALLAIPDLDADKLGDDKWWEATEPVLRNPMYSKKMLPQKLANWHQGYAMNRMIPNNLGYTGSWDEGDKGPNSHGTSLSEVTQQTRTPLVAPNVDNWHYVGSDLGRKINEGFLIEGKLPILFVDGHVESMTPAQYIEKEYDKQPLKN